MKRDSRLKFTDAELATPKLKEAILKSKKMADKVDNAQAKIPKKKTIKKEHILNESTGKAKVRLKFEEECKAKPISKLEHTKQAAPRVMIQKQLHNKISKEGDDNTSVRAVHESEKKLEFTARRISSVYRARQREPFYKLAKAEKKSINADLNYLYKKSRLQSTSTNPISKWQQKRSIKKQYLATRYGRGVKSVNTKPVRASLNKGVNVVGRAAFTMLKNPKVILIIGILLVIITLSIVILSSLSTLFQGAVNQVVSTSYTSEDSELISANNSFTNLENSLQSEINNIETTRFGYDEYRYDLDDIVHDPHQLAAYLTALEIHFIASDMQAEIQSLFNQMYQLTTTEVVEIRYRTETRTGTYITLDEEGKEVVKEYEYEVEVPENYYILEVKLTSQSINEVVNRILLGEKLEMYNVYRQTLGNKPLLFGGGSFDGSESTDLSGVVFIEGERVGNQEIVDIALSQVGNVGGQPYWSWYGFDSYVAWCATFVSWTLNQAGYSEPKFAACQSQGVAYFTRTGRWANRGYEHIAPGDVIFFDWEGDGGSDHVGIVIGTDGTKVYTVEGNSGNACKTRSYDLNSSVIKGYGLMN